MKKSILTLALAGSLFVSQPVKPISSVRNGVEGAVAVIIGACFLNEVFSLIYRTTGYKSNSFKRNLKVFGFTLLGLMFIDQGITILDK